MAFQAHADRVVVRALAAGDERAFNELVGRHHRALVRLARNFVRSEAIAEEVAQDTWCGVLSGIGSFEGRSSLKTWIFAVCMNKARTRAVREARTITGGPAVPRAWDDPERRVISLELRADLRAALDRLPERQRLVVTLRDVEGFEIEEIGRLLDITPGNARVLLHRGRARLRAALPDALAAF